MISPISVKDFVHSEYKLKAKNNNAANNSICSDNTNLSKPINSELLKNYYVPFTGKVQNSIKLDNKAQDFKDRLTGIANDFGHSEINQYHVMYLVSLDMLDYIDRYKNGKTYKSEIHHEPVPCAMADDYGDEFLFNANKIKKSEKLFRDFNNEILKKLKAEPAAQNNRQNGDIVLSKGLLNDIALFKDTVETQKSAVSLEEILAGAFASSLPDVMKVSEDFSLRLNDIIMSADENSKTLYFNSYNSKANEVMEKLGYGMNIFLTYDDKKIIPEYIIPNIKSAIASGEYKFNSDNVKLVQYNDKISIDHLLNSIDKFEKDKNNQYLIIVNQGSLSKNYEDDIWTDEDYAENVKHLPKNVHLILIDTKDNYLKGKEDNSKLYDDFVEMTIPVISADDVNHAVAENEKYTKKFSKSALEKVVQMSFQLEGKLPDKTVKLIERVQKFYNEKTTPISANDIDVFMREAKILPENNNDDSLEMVADTGKRLKDIVGKENTKKEAANIVKQITNGKIGTKGFVIFSEDGSVGSGRRHTAEAIAGEAHIPFFALNALDFGTKDVSIFGGGSLSPEASMKKVFSLVTAQAESNPNKSAELFIENFEYFSIGEMVSEYHQKAMAQLIREMNNAEKRGFNIVVIGSVNDPEMMGEAIQKSFKFNDTIEVSSPADSQEARYEILQHAFKNIKIAGNKKEQNELLYSMSKTLEDFAFIDIRNFAKKSEFVAMERGHKRVTKGDMVEAYLRMTTGRPNLSNIRQHEKEITTKHECGHAITLQIMHDLMVKINRPWLIPDNVNFIALDPRGNYLGAMYPKVGDNTERSFETMFADIVCDYGGHSSEKLFYGIDGSWGITGDLGMATNSAKLMVKMMGQGYNTGKISLVHTDESTLTQSMKEKIEKDIDVITRNALTVSDAIVDVYSDFIEGFSQRHASKVGTGECLIDGDEFRKELQDWKDSQPEGKKAELELLDKMILDAITATKNGKIY